MTFYQKIIYQDHTHRSGGGLSTMFYSVYIATSGKFGSWCLQKYSLLQHELENLRRSEADGARPMIRGDTPVPPDDAAG